MPLELPYYAQRHALVRAPSLIRQQQPLQRLLVPALPGISRTYTAHS